MNNSFGYDNKHVRANFKRMIGEVKRNPNYFWRRFITFDETWIHHSIPETKEQTKQWVFHTESSPQMAKTTLSTNKIMATVFWDARVIHINNLEKGKTINANLLDSFNHPVKEKYPHLPKKKNSLLVHTYVIAMAKVNWVRIRIASASTVFARFSLQRLFPFTECKKWFGAKIFGSNNDLKQSLLWRVGEIVFFRWDTKDIKTSY